MDYKMETDELDKVIKAAELGDAHAQFLMAGANMLSKVYETAIKWYTSAAEQGHDSAQFDLGVIYDFGTGVSKNPSFTYDAEVSSLALNIDFFTEIKN